MSFRRLRLICHPALLRTFVFAATFCLSLRSITAADHLSPQQILKLSNQAGELYRAKRYSESLPLYQRAYEAAEETLKPDDERIAIYALDLGLNLYLLGKGGEAIPYLNQAIAITEKKQGSRSPFLADILLDTLTVLEQEGRAPEAETIIRRRINILESTKGATHPDTLASLDRLGMLLCWQLKWPEAQQIYNRVLTVREASNDHDGYATSLVNLGRLEFVELHYAEAVSLYERALALDIKDHGLIHPLVERDWGILGYAYGSEGQWQKSLDTYGRFIDAYPQVYPNDSGGLALSLITLGSIARNQGEFLKAASILQRAATLANTNSDTLVQQYAWEAKKELANTYVEAGRYREALDLYEKVLPYYSNALNPVYSIGIRNDEALAMADLGQYTQAEQLFKQALSDTNSVSTKLLETPTFRDSVYSLRSTILLNLASLAQVRNDDTRAEALYAQALATEKTVGMDIGAHASTLRAAAGFYSTRGQFGKAEELLREALQLADTSFGTKSYPYALVLLDIAETKRLEKQNDDAETLYLRSLDILGKTVGTDHPSAGKATEGYALLSAAQGRVDAADEMFQRSIANIQHEFDYLFPEMSERERLQFLQRMQDRLDEYYSFTLRNSQQANVVSHVYALLLWQKALVVSSIASVRSNISSTNDPQAQLLWSELRQKRAEIAGLYNSQHRDSSAGDTIERFAMLETDANPTEYRNMPKTDPTDRIMMLETDANRLERSLISRFPALAEDHNLGRLAWTAVRDRLGSDDAAVEFVRFRYHDGRSWTKNSRYMALIVRPGTTTPHVVDLGNAAVLERRVNESYRALIDRPAVAGRGIRLESGTTLEGDPFQLYQAVWKPLEGFLKGVKRVFVSPDGELNTISFGAIPISQEARILDILDLRIVTSTRDLLHQKKETASNSAILVGNPDFDLDLHETRTEPLLKDVEVLNIVQLRSHDLEGTLQSLPETLKEVNSIGELLKARGWLVELHTGTDARESVLENVHAPRVLHLATHGFFYPSQRNSVPEGSLWWENPMLRSGLFLAGANHTLAGHPTSEAEDGVLTALEAESIDLQATELVVLSACETGLGETKNGEGVFGLRRALQIAGANSILMSLWSVPDLETEELMTLFYSHWLDGRDKHSALHEAQQEMRQRVLLRYGRDIPFYWAAFVLTGT